MGYVRKRAGRFYGTWIDESGRKVERAIRARTLTEARRLVDEVEAQASRVRLGLSDADSGLTIQGAWEKYAPIAQAKRSWRTLEGRFRNHILPALGGRRMQSIRPADIEAFLAERAGTGLSPQTVEHLRVHLAALFTFARTKLRALEGDNPARLADAPEIPAAAPRFLERSQVQAILEEVEPRWTALFAVAVYTGARKGEILGLRRSDVDLERRSITIARSYEGATKANKVRWVPISRELLPYLQRQLRKLEQEEYRGDYLFPGDDGRGLSPDFDAGGLLASALRRAGLLRGYELVCRRRTCRHREESRTGEGGPCPKCGFRLYVRELPLRIAFKDLRSTHATHAYEATGDIRYVQRVLGHSDPRVTERVYAGMRTEQLLAQADRVSFSAGPSDSLPIPSDETSRTETNGDDE